MSDKPDKLFQAARQERPDTSRVEFAFETRLLARLRTPAEPWTAWTWRLAPVFAAVVLALGIWNYTVPVPNIETTDEATLASVLVGD